MTILSSIFLLFSILYGIIICLFYKGLRSLSVFDEKGSYSYSVVIAARNEQVLLRLCLDSVLHQTMSPDRYEVILVDDRSTDKTLEIARDYASKYPNLIVKHVEKVPDGISPKKNAVACGITAASKEIIVFTDADCVVPSGWLEAIDKTFAPSTGLVQGITKYSKVPDMNHIFWSLQSIDFLSHGVVAASAIGAGIPINSNANNFAFRREAFLESGGYDSTIGKIVSGDDDLLLQKISKSKRWNIRYMIDSSGIVFTLPTRTIRGVFEQRKRWGSKTVHYNPLQVVILSGIFIFYLSIITALVGSFFSLTCLYWGLCMAGIKLIGEATLMLPGIRIFREPALRPYIIPASIIQLPMVISAVFTGVFGRFKWKDQKFARKIKK